MVNDHKEIPDQFVLILKSAPNRFIDEKFNIEYCDKSWSN